MARSAEMLATLLGILQVGAAYIPLDLSHPAERLRRVLVDGPGGTGIRDGNRGRRIRRPACASRPSQRSSAIRFLPKGWSRFLYLSSVHERPSRILASWSASSGSRSMRAPRASSR